MSLQAAAQHLASRGRGPDTTLVHMAPSEVAGLQALARAHGGTLTTNPETGLPEAGFLKNILPMVLGAGLAATGVGAPMAAMLVGGLQTARTGSLEKGLMAGLGAYGGAGLGAGLMGAGEAALAAAPAGAVPAELAATQAAQTQNALTSLGLPSNAAAGVGNASFVPQMSANQLAGIAPKVAGPASTTAFTAGAEPLSQVATATPMPSAAATASGFDKMRAGLGNLGAMANMSTAKYGLAALAPALLQTQGPAQYRGSGPNPYDFAFDWERPQAPLYDSREALQLRGRLRGLAEGGPVGEMSESNAALTLMANGGQMYAEGGETKADVAKGMTGASADAMRYLMGEAPMSPATLAAQGSAMRTAATTPVTTPAASTQSGGLLTRMSEFLRGSQGVPEFVFDPATGTMQAIQTTTPAPAPAVDYTSYAKGGVSHLGDYSDGGRLLRGPGDGVSDSIPATIADKRPARLADGEFVVPARIVSELGNGSTEAGARKLYAMMDRIQKARSKTVGKDRVAVNSRADKALPA